MDDDTEKSINYKFGIKTTGQIGCYKLKKKGSNLPYLKPGEGMAKIWTESEKYLGWLKIGADSPGFRGTSDGHTRLFFKPNKCYQGNYWKDLKLADWLVENVWALEGRDLLSIIEMPYWDRPSGEEGWQYAWLTTLSITIKIYLCSGSRHWADMHASGSSLIRIFKNCCFFNFLCVQLLPVWEHMQLSPAAIPRVIAFFARIHSFFEDSWGRRISHPYDTQVASCGASSVWCCDFKHCSTSSAAASASQRAELKTVCARL